MSDIPPLTNAEKQALGFQLIGHVIDEWRNYDMDHAAALNKISVIVSQTRLELDRP
jgi:hypothetical protein